MEPIYSVEVLTPSEYMGAVMSDLQNRRAMIEGMESDKGFDRLNARVPLAELYRYSTTLSSLTSGIGDLLDEVRILRAGARRRAGEAAQGLQRHRRGVIPVIRHGRDGCRGIRPSFRSFSRYGSRRAHRP